jgi:hypothetical protein
VKQNKKAKICFVNYIAGEKKLLFYIYAVIVKQKKKSSANHYFTQILVITQIPRITQIDPVQAKDVGI